MTPNMEQVTIAGQYHDRIKLLVRLIDNGKIGRADLIQKDLTNQDRNQIRQEINQCKVEIIQAINRISVNEK